MSTQFARDNTHSKKGLHFSAASAKCNMFDKAAISGERAYPCTAADMAEVLLQKRRPDGLVETVYPPSKLLLRLRAVPVH